jgi:regulator of protease activity HflC (stomatin/prohibitin superfamily)
MTRYGGSTLAQTYTDMHESDRGQSFEYGSSARMDIYNNLIGRALATAEFAKNMSVSELLEYALNNNLLATSRDDPKLSNFDINRVYDCKK